ncbi:MAG: cytochrome P450 [Streptosporangiales bacterium]|nr:cytochrome P450 [Streptosporangiales bacterium]
MERFPVGASATVEELDRDPHPLLARLRATEPVSWLPTLDGWLVTSRDAALRLLRDSRTFTVDDPRFSTARVIGPSMLSLDGREHTRHREPFARPFRPGETRARFTGFVEAETERLVTVMAPAGHADLREALAGPLAVAVVTEALGLRGVDQATIRSWYDAFVAAVSGITAGASGAAEPGPAARHAHERLRAAVLGALEDPGGQDALLADVVRHAAGLDSAEIVANAAVLMFGGIDTTEGMITNAVHHVYGDPGLVAAIRHDPALLAAAVEESVRLEPAASVVDRYATADAELDGAAVRRGDLVRVSIAGANRDPAVFTDPDRLDPRRENAAEHLAFAHGPHFCFGAHLARLETVTVLRTLLDRLPGLRLDPDHPAAARGLVFRKPRQLRVRW